MELTFQSMEIFEADAVKEGVMSALLESISACSCIGLDVRVWGRKHSDR
jgi:hypothetical protein